MTTNQLAYQKMITEKGLKEQELSQLKDVQQSQIALNDAKTAVAEIEKLITQFNKEIAEYDASKLQYKGGGAGAVEVIMDWMEQLANIIKPFSSMVGKQYNTGNRSLFG